jgi:hypothetical protein
MSNIITSKGSDNKTNSVIFKCGKCNFRTNRRSTLYNHLKSISHNLILTEKEFTESKYKCHTCHVIRKDHSAIKKHFKTKKHNSMVDKYGLHEKDNYCFACKSPFYSEKTLISHTKTKKHMNKLIIYVNDLMNTQVNTKQRTKCESIEHIHNLIQTK